MSEELLPEPDYPRARPTDPWTSHEADETFTSTQVSTRKLLKTYRRRAKVTQVQAAEYLELPIGTYRDYEQGLSEPRPIVRAGIEALIEAWEDQYFRLTGKVFFDTPVPSK